jgi:hypothetical protein
MCKLHYPRLTVSMLKEPPILKMFFCSSRYVPHGTTFEFEHLGEFKIEIKNILEHESGAHMGLIHEKNQRPKISCYCTFNANSIQYYIIKESRSLETRSGGSLEY